MFRRGGSTLRDIVSSALSQSKPFVRKQHILPSSKTLLRNLSKKTLSRCFSPLTPDLPRKLPTATVTFPRNIFTTGVVRFGETVDSLHFNLLKYSYSVNYNIVDENYSYLSLARTAKTDKRRKSVYIQVQDIEEVLKAFTYMVHNSSKDESISIRSAAKSYVTYQMVKSSFVVNPRHFRPKTVRYIEITESKPNPSESPYSTCIYEEAWIPVLSNISIMVDRHFSKNMPHTEVSPENVYSHSTRNELKASASPKNAFRHFSQNESYSKVSPENVYGHSTRNELQTSSPKKAFRHFSKNDLHFISGNETLNVGEMVDVFKFPVLNKKYLVGYQEINKHRKVFNICQVSENGKNTSILIEKDDVEEILKALKYMAQTSPKEASITINSASTYKTYQVMRTSFGNRIKRNCIDIRQSLPGTVGGFNVTINEPGWNQAIEAISTMFDKHINKSEPISEWF